MAGDLNVQNFQSFLDEHLIKKEQGSLKVLEAGCGSMSYLSFGDNAYKAGIDISKEQLERNTYLDEKIEGDIQQYALPKNEFDIVVCWNVLEHLPNPLSAVTNFIETIKDDGLIILAMPNVSSLKGFITKYSPHWFHVWYYRNLLDSEHAGEVGYAPFKTFLNREISPKNLKNFALSKSMDIAYFSLFESGQQKGVRKKSILIHWLLAILNFPILLFSLGKVSGNHTDYILALRKK